MRSMIKVCGMDIVVEGSLFRTARLDLDKYHFVDDPEPLLEGLRKCGHRIDLFTFLQRLPESAPKYTYPMELDNLAAIPISTFDHWWNHQIRSFPRNRARQAEKRGVTIREVPFDDVLVRGIWEVYNECPVRQGRPFTHYGKDIETVYKEEATYLDSSIFIGAFIDESLIGFVKLVYDQTRTQAGLMNILSTIKHRDKAPTNALVAQAVRSCADRGISYLVYSNFIYRKRERDSVTDFKERNAFQRFDLPRYYAPLTPLGATAFRLGLHHGFADCLPQSLMTKLRGVRTDWYKRKFQVETEAS
jgi:hypothetical protein